MCVDLNKALGIRDEKGNKCYPFGNYHWELLPEKINWCKDKISSDLKVKVKKIIRQM